jgi:hypothetical protein
MTVSHDGSTLYAVDRSNFKIVPVNLATLSKGTPWSLSGVPTNPRLVYTRTGGLGVVLAGDGRVYNATTGVAFPQTFFGDVPELTAARNGRLFCAEVVCRTLDHSTVGGAQLSIGGLSFLNIPVGTSNVTDVAISDDATRVYIACGFPYDFLVFDGTTMNQVGVRFASPYPNNAEIAADGRFFGGASAAFSPTVKGIWVFDPGGALLAEYAAGGFNLLPRQLRISGDGLRMTTLTSDPALIFTTVGP